MNYKRIELGNNWNRLGLNGVVFGLRVRKDL